MRRREFIAGCCASAAWPLAARAQKSLPRIGWLVFGDAKLGPIDQSLKDALAQAGLLDGRNIEIIFRYANGNPDRLFPLAPLTPPRRRQRSAAPTPSPRPPSQ